MRIVGSPQAWQRFKDLEEQVIADQFAEALFDPSPAEDGHRELREDVSARGVQELSAQKSDKQSAHSDEDPARGVPRAPHLVEGVELALKFSLTPEQTLRICGSHLSSKERVKACQKFVQNWLMHSSVAELTAYLEKK